MPQSSAPASAEPIHFIPNRTLIPQFKLLLEEGHTVTFAVRGTSMRPFLDHARDKVTLRACRPEDIRKGQAVLAETEPRHYVLHRIASIEGEHITLRGDGNPYTTETCRRKDILGVVTLFHRKDNARPDSTTGLKWRIYSALWPSSPIVRRILLGLHRRIFKRKK